MKLAVQRNSPNRRIADAEDWQNDLSAQNSIDFAKMNSDVDTKPTRRKKTRKHYKTFHELYITADQKLGEGSFGQVTTYQNIETSREVAVKVVQKLRNHDRTKVLKEIEVLHHCGKHQNIVEMLEFFEEGCRIYLVFEKLDGGSLLHNIHRIDQLTEGSVSDVIKEITCGLQCLHSNGIAHRDLKPSNIVCVCAGRLVPLKLIDFDLASDYVYDSSNSQKCVSTPRLRSPVGSFEYMAPDVVTVWKAIYPDWSTTYDKRCDLWSLGVILYLLLCGYMPFRGEDCGNDCGWRRGFKCDTCQNLLFEEILEGHYNFPDKEWEDVSEDAKNLISQLLVTNPRQRLTADRVLKHPWISTCVHPAHSHILGYHSRKFDHSDAPQLSDNVENANKANRLVHSHFNRNLSSVEFVTTEHSNSLQPGDADSSSCDVFCRNSTRIDDAVLHATNVASMPANVIDWGRSLSWHSEDQELMFAMSDVDDSDCRDSINKRSWHDLSTGLSLVCNVIDLTSDQLDHVTEVDSGKGNSGSSDGILQHFEFPTLPAP